MLLTLAAVIAAAAASAPLPPSASPPSPPAPPPPPPGPVPASCNVATAGADYKNAPGLVFPSTPKYPHGFRTVDSPADCCAMCQTLANCSFWTYETTTPAKPTCYSLDGACCFLRTAAAYGAGSTNPGATGGSTEPLPAFDFNNPKIHQSPDCVHEGGWHDMAGALTFKGVHHSFQGCPASGGWSHSSSTDLVHWKDEGRGVHILQENYEGTSALHTGRATEGTQLVFILIC